MRVGVLFANIAMASSVMTYSILPGKQFWQGLVVFALAVSFLVRLRIVQRLHPWIVMLISFYFLVWSVAALGFAVNFAEYDITSVPFNSILYPFTFVGAIWVGVGMRLNPERYAPMVLLLFLLITAAAILAYVVPSLPLCKARRPMMILPGDAVCGVVNNPNYYSFCALTLFAWYRLLHSSLKAEFSLSVKMRPAKPRMLDWDMLALLGSSRMALIALLVHKSFGLKLVYPLVAALMVFLIYAFSPSRLDFSISDRLLIWEFALSFLESRPMGVFAPEIYRLEMLSVIGIDGEFQNSMLGMSVIFGMPGLLFYILVIISSYILINRLTFEQRFWAIAILLSFVLNGLVRTNLPGGVGFLSLSCGMLLGFSSVKRFRICHAHAGN